MKQPKYSPEEALDRIKLMMKYDLSKTLNENRLSEAPNRKTRITPQRKVTVTPPTVTSKNTSWIKNLFKGGAGAATFRTAATSVGTLLRGGALLGGATIAGVGILALTPLVIWLATKDSSAEKVEKFFKMCSTHKAQFDKLNATLSNEDIRTMADEIQDGINYTFMGFAGTDESKIEDAFNKLENATATDFCNLVQYYNNNSDSGDLYDDLDSDLDSDEDWNIVYRPLRNCVESSLKQIGNEVINDCKTNPNQEHCKQIVKQPDSATNIQTITTPSGQITFDTNKSCGTSIKNVFVVFDTTSGAKYYITPKSDGGYEIYSGDTTNIVEYCQSTSGGGTATYQPCKPGQYTYGCYAEAVGQVQRCLGNLTIDNKFGPKTAAALKNIGYTSFTDADIPKICNKESEIPINPKKTTSDEFVNRIDPNSPESIMNNK